MPETTTPNQAARVTAFEPEYISATMAAINNRFLELGQTDLFELGDASFRLRFDGNRTAFPPGFVVDIAIGSRSFRLDTGDIENSDLFSIGGIFLCDLPLDLRGAFLDALTAPCLTALERQTGQECHIKPVYDQNIAVQHSGRLPFQLIREADGRKAPFNLGASDEDLTWLAESLETNRKPPTEAPDYLLMTGQIILGQMRLTTEELADLEPGDVLLASLTTGSAAIRIGQIELRGSVDPNKFTVEDIMTEPHHPTEATSMDTDQLEIPLTFGLGSLTLTLGELKNLTPGHVLTLAGNLEQPVSIHANGRLIGRGELVRVDDHPGVRLVEVCSHDR